MKRALTILSKTLRVWQWLKVCEALAYGLGIGLFVLPFTGLTIAIATVIIAFIAALWGLKPWAITLKNVASLFDNRYSEVENSTHLLLEKQENLTLLARLQQNRVAKHFANHKAALPPHKLSFAAVFIVGMMLIGYGLSRVIPKNHESPQLDNTLPTSTHLEEDTIAQAHVVVPEILNATLTIDPPDYTGVKVNNTSELNIEAIEGSRLIWRLTTNEAVDEMLLETSGKSAQKMQKSGNTFTISAKIRENGFYNFRLTGIDQADVITDLYQIKVIEDQPPSVALKGIRQYESFDYDDKKEVKFQTTIQDDFGLTDAYIIATVAKGSGESVKFREEKLLFDQSVSGKQASLYKSIHLDEMGMTPGDELYFYVEAFDNKHPVRQKTRTETYFLSIKDTTDIEFSLAGSLGVDLMPEYFRSQRQLIIDTEKLIEEKAQLSKQDFNFRSNELGFDQKALRLKYGQFMGVENESGIAIETEEVLDEVQEESDDPLAEYSHDHDGDNEHNLVTEDHEEESPLEEYMHDHDDPEEATLYTQSTRSMLKVAMSEMWDAELYLRLYQPEKSLPYQYKALELIKKIKNHARIYVHRIGFDPPPIKEDKRLTGELGDVKSTTYAENIAKSDDLEAIKEVISVIEDIIINRRPVENDEYELFEQAANTLAPYAIEQPVQFLKPLEVLKKLGNRSIADETLYESLAELNKDLVRLLPIEKDEIIPRRHPVDALTKIYLERLNKADNE